MEEVWKDIALTNLQPKFPSPDLSIHHTAAAAAAFHDFLSGAFRDPDALHSPDPLPSRSLSLRSGGHHNAFLPRKRHAVHHPPPSAIADGSEERRFNKMIKNRESAARSRARKQAYTNELEMEVANLVRENAALKREQEELKMAMAAQATSKGKLQRALSSPF